MDYAIAYCRESKEKADRREAEGMRGNDFVTTSIANQEKGAMEQADIDSLKLVKVFKDVNVQSTTISRQGFNEMLRFIEQNRIKRLYIKNYTRLGRGQPFFTLRKKLIQKMPKRDIFFWEESSEHRINIEDDSIVGIKTYANLLQIEQNRKSYMNMQRSKKKEERPYISPPFGYRWKEKKWIIDKKKAEVVKNVFEMARQGISYKEICKECKISPSMYYKIIRNRNYTGMVSHNQKIKNDDGEVLRVEKVEYKGGHEPIISSELFDRVQG